MAQHGQGRWMVHLVIFPALEYYMAWNGVEDGLLFDKQTEKSI